MNIKSILLYTAVILGIAFNTLAQTTVPGGQVSGTWNIAGSPYNVTGSIQIPNGQTLTINSGVEVIFQGNYKLVVSGRLLAIGLLNDTINFKCSNTSVGWQGIRFENTAATNDTSIIQYCKLQNGKPADGNGGSFYFSNFSKAIIKNCLIQNNSVAASGGGIYLSSSSPVINNNTIRYVSSINAGGGIYATSSSSVIEYNTFSNITGGSSWPQIGGGGICISGGSPIIRNNTIQNNSVVGAGAGIYLNGATNIQITNNTITNNSTSSDKGGGLCIINVSGISNINFNTITNNSQNSSSGTHGGGGIYLERNLGGDGNTLIKGNTISYNTAKSLSGPYGGGGIFVKIDSDYNLLVDSNIIDNNSVIGGSGGALVFYSGNGGTTNTSGHVISRNKISFNTSPSNGGAICCRNTTPIFKENYIVNNTANSNGGAFYLVGSPCTISNNLISNNTATIGQGGAIFFAGSNATLTNNTISNNKAVKGGALSFSGSSSNHTNDILFGNSASQSGNQVNVQDVNSNPNFSYCNLQGGSASFEMNNNIYMGNYLNNINSNPLFVSPTAGSGSSFNALNANWQLQNSSPSIDAGSPSGTYSSQDLIGNSRVIGCIIDQGAFENLNSPNIVPIPSIIVSGSTTFCQGDSVTLTSSSVNGNTWPNGETSQSISAKTSGNYTVTVTNANNCSATSTITIVTVNALPATPSISSNGATTFCQGGSVQLTSSTATGNVWSNGATSQSITVNNSGNYSVTVNDVNNCSATSSATTVTVNALPPAPTISSNGSTTFCQGGSVQLTSSSAIGNAWSNGATSQSITVNNAGNYSVTVADANNCSASSSPTAITVNALPATPTISSNGATTFCDGGSVQLTSSSASGNLWSNGATSQSITVNNSGNYSATVTNANNCSASSSPTAITVNALPPTPSISSNSSTTFCDGGSVQLTSSSATGNQWSNGATSQSINVNNSGNYSVTVTNANNCSAASSPTAITVNTLPPTPTISSNGPTMFCDGGSVQLTSSSATGNQWSNGATSQSITVNNSGNYSVTITNTNNCSAVSSPTAIIVNALPPTPTISSNGATTFCDGGSVQLTSSSATGNQWSNGATSQSITVNNSGNFSVTVTNANNCSAISQATAVTVNALPAIPTISSNGATTFCDGGSVQLTSSSATGNQWSNGATSQTISANSGGNYGVTVTNAEGCSNTNQVLVTVNPNLVNNISAWICNGEPYSMGGNLYGTPGIYSDTLLNQYGCDSVIVLVLGEDPGPVAPQIIGNSSIVPLQINNYQVSPSPDINYSWFVTGGAITGGQNTPSINVIFGTSAPYLVGVIATNTFGCSDTTILNINSNPVAVGNWNQNNLNIYPNPAKDLLFLNFTDAATRNITIYNLLGSQLLEVTTAEQYNRISLNDTFTSGQYLIKITDNKGTNANYRLTIIR